MTQTAMKMSELDENKRHNRQQELIDSAKVVTNALGSLASIYTKRIPKAESDFRKDTADEFESIGKRVNRSFSRRR